ncbi:MAG: uL22 family ribosomal protein [Nanoarchaeota archaeon]
MADEQLNQTKIQKHKMPVERTNVAHAPVKENKKEESKTEHQDHSHTHADGSVHDHKHADGHENKTGEIKKEDVKVETKKTEKKVKKHEASVYGRSLNVSLKQSIGIGRFIKNLKIEDAIKNLERVSVKKMAVPFKGEMAHKKGRMLNGKKMMTGKYPINASKAFIVLLKSLLANSSANGMDLDKTRISEVIPNKSPKQHHRFGSTVFKRTHILIKSKEMNLLKKGSKKDMNQIKPGVKTK